MGNICEIFSKNKKYEDETIIKAIPVAKPIYNNLDNSNNIPVGSPLYNDYLPSYNEVYASNNITPNYNNQQRPQIIVLNQSPYYNDNGTSMMTGFLGGMLIEDILDGY